MTAGMVVAAGTADPALLILLKLSKNSWCGAFSQELAEAGLLGQSLGGGR